VLAWRIGPYPLPRGIHRIRLVLYLIRTNTSWSWMLYVILILYIVCFLGTRRVCRKTLPLFHIFTSWWKSPGSRQWTTRLCEYLECFRPQLEAHVSCWRRSNPGRRSLPCKQQLFAQYDQGYWSWHLWNALLMEFTPQPAQTCKYL